LIGLRVLRLRKREGEREQGRERKRELAFGKAGDAMERPNLSEERRLRFNAPASPGAAENRFLKTKTQI
jgi:hypothetical protein